MAFGVFSDAYCFVGFLTQLFYILTPITFIIQLHFKAIDLERVSIFGLLSLYCNAFIYFLTSLQKRTSTKIDPLDYSNMTGAYLGFIYLILYIYYVHLKKDKKKGIIFISILAIGTVVVGLIIGFTVKEKDDVGDQIFSWLAVIFNVTEYFPLGFSIIYLFKHKVSEKYTIFGAFFGLLNCIAWLAWAIHAITEGSNLWHSVVANILGICLEITQFILIFLFKRKDEEDNSNIENTTNTLEEGKAGLEDMKEENNDPEYMQGYI
jgi:hypothetical protein